MLERLKDQELLQNCKVQVQLEKAATSKVLDYLIEIDKRRLWIQEGYSSLFDFCVRFLGYSEGEANRRIQAARLSQKVQEVKPLLEQGQISLSSLTLLSPVLTPHNAQALLPKVINQPTRQVEKIIREHFPERTRPKEYFQVEIDEELRTLLEKAKQIASEKNDPVFFKKIVKAYIREKQPRHRESKHTRRVPLHTAREIKKQAGYRCEYISPSGVRCSQTARLEIDHVRPYALGGSSRDKENLRCLCKTHNLFMAAKHFPKHPALMKSFASGGTLGPW
jgi:hypothetical protein